MSQQVISGIGFTPEEEALLASIRPVSRDDLLATTDFDIVATCNKLLASNPDFTKPVAAIHSLIALLKTVPMKTIHETVDMLKAQAKRLKDSVEIGAPFYAGTDLFIEFFTSSMAQPGDDFDALLRHLLRNGTLFADRAKAARDDVARRGAKFVVEDQTVLTFGPSRCVAALLEVAARTDPGGPKFRVVYVRDAHDAKKHDAFVANLRRLNVPTAEIDVSAVAHVMALLHRVHAVIVGAEAITGNGGVLSRMGTFQIARLAFDNKPKLPFYVAAETHKFSRDFPPTQLYVDQGVLDFGKSPRPPPKDLVDYTPPSLIRGLITESGIRMPEYVAMTLAEIYDDPFFVGYGPGKRNTAK